MRDYYRHECVKQSSNYWLEYDVKFYVYSQEPIDHQNQSDVING